MLISMHIENIAVIRRLDVDFDQGFTVLTGETGAGKSMIIDSIGLLLGAKTQRELMRSPQILLSWGSLPRRMASSPSSVPSRWTASLNPGSTEEWFRCPCNGRPANVWCLSTGSTIATD